MSKIIDDYTETMDSLLTAKTSVLNDYDFTDTIAFDQSYEGVPGQNMLFYGMPIRKKRFEDDTNGIWLGVDADGLAKINIGDGTISLQWDGSSLDFVNAAGDIAGITWTTIAGIEVLQITSSGAIQLVAPDGIIASGDLAVSETLAVMAASGVTAGGVGAISIYGLTAFGIYFGSGAPSVSASKGSLYMRTDGSTTNDRAYINTNGSTTWTAIITAA